MQDKANTPAEVNDTQLDDISGGPHFRNFHRVSYDFQSGCDVVMAKNDNIEIHAHLAEKGKS